MTDRYATEYPVDQTGGQISSKHTQGRLRYHGATIAALGTESADDRVYCGAIASNAVLSGLSNIDCSAITSSVADIGGNATGTDFLADGLSLATAGNKAIFSGSNGVGRLALNKPFWELLGFTADPGGQIDIWLIWKTAPTASGAAQLNLIFATE